VTNEVAYCPNVILYTLGKSQRAAHIMNLLGTPSVEDEWQVLDSLEKSPLNPVSIYSHNLTYKSA